MGLEGTIAWRILYHALPMAASKVLCRKLLSMPFAHEMISNRGEAHGHHHQWLIVLLMLRWDVHKEDIMLQQVVIRLELLSIRRRWNISRMLGELLTVGRYSGNPKALILIVTPIE